MARDLLFLFGVYLREHDVGMVFRYLFVGRRKRTTGTAPGRPEIDQNRFIRLQHPGFKAAVVNFQ